MTEISFQIKEFKEDEIEMMKQEFEKADKNGDGSIDKHEFIKFSKNRGISKDAAELLFFLYATDDDDIYFEDFQKYLKLLQECEKEGSEMPLWHAFFDKLDTDKSGSITFDEFLEFGKICCPNVAPDQLKKEFSSVDTDDNGSIEFEEMLKLLGK